MTGRISDERFTELSADYEAEQRELKERAAAIQREELSKAQEATVNAEKFMNVVRRHTSLKNLPYSAAGVCREKSLCMSAAMTRNAGARPADRTLKFITLLLARWTLPE